MQGYNLSVPVFVFGVLFFSYMIEYLSAKSSFILGENKAGFHRESHIDSAWHRHFLS